MQRWTVDATIAAIIAITLILLISLPVSCYLADLAMCAQQCSKTGIGYKAGQNSMCECIIPPKHKPAERPQ